MALAKIISQLDSAEPSEKEKHYTNISNLFLENADGSFNDISCESIKNLFQNILDDLRKEKENAQLVKLFHILLYNKGLQRFFSDIDKEQIFKDVINTIDSTKHEDVLINYFSVLIQMPSFPNAEDSVLNDLLQRIDEVLSNRKDPASTYAACNYFQKFLKDYEERLSNFVPVLSKTVFLPLCHPSEKVREVAEKNLDIFPKILLYSLDEESTSCLLKLLKESYGKEMLQLFKEKQEIYVLKIWTHVVKALGSAVSANLSNIPSFFQVIEKGFKSSTDDICIASFIAWKSLIDSFAGTEGALNDSKRLRFILKPFKNISRLNENILSVACDTWMHLAWNLAEYLSDRFSEVCVPLLELTVGKISNGLSEKISHKGGSVILVKKACYILLRFLELPPNDAFSRLASPKKLPHIPFPTLQTPLDIKIITHHFKEILCVIKIIIDCCGTKDDMRQYLDCLMKSVLFIVSSIIEDTSKESTEAVYHFINFLSDIIDAKTYYPLACLKCLESLSKLPRKVLLSHNFNCGSRKPQGILCNSLLKMLLSPHLFPSEQPKRFFAAYNRLIQAGVHESFYPLSNAHKFMHVIRNAIGTITIDGDVLIELWSSVASTLLEVIEKTQEVNQGDKQEHDFSCMYDMLLFPFEFIFPVYIHQFRTRPVTKLWTNLYKAFICSASLVSTTSPNEACENFCAKLKNCLKDDVLKKPHFMESFCLFFQSVMDSIDFAYGSTSSTQGIVDVANMMKRKRPLGNLTSFVDLLVILLKAFYAYYVEAEEDSTQSSAPTIQRKVHIVKNAAPLDILKTFFGNVKTASTISLAMEQLVDPIAKLFVKSSQKRNLMSHGDSKLEMLWNVITSSIERYYLGPYDSEFLILMSPLLEATFSHPRRNIKEKSRRFWFATFGPNVSTLKFPESLKNLLKKMKLPLLPDDISPTEFSISPMPDSLPEDSSEIIPSPVPLALTKPFKSPVGVNGDILPKIVPKEIKKSPKISIEDLPSEEFVRIESPIVSTPRQRKKRRSYVPTLYNDLSQDTATLMSSSESQDTTNSASLEEISLKDSVVEVVPKTSAKVLLSTPSSSHKDPVVESKSAKSSIAIKVKENFDDCLSKDQSKENNPQSIEIISETETNKISNNLTPEATESSSKENKTKNLISDKISVFSKPGEKDSISRNTRRNARLSKSFSETTEKISTKIDSQKLNKSCVDFTDLCDSDDIIPSSQGSSETENGVKLSVNNGNQKSQLSDDSNLNITEKLQQHCLSPENSVIDNECKDLVTDNVNFVTSTPSKSKLSSPIIANEISEKNKSYSPNAETDTTKESTNKMVENQHQEVLPETFNPCKESNVQVNSKEVISNMDTSLDATSEKSDTVVAFHNFQSDAEMKSGIKSLDPCVPAEDQRLQSLNKSNEIKSQLSIPHLLVSLDITNLSVPENKTTVSVDSDIQEKIPSPYEPIAKRSRLSLKLTEKSSDNENYSQKLRKKNINTDSKLPQKPRRKRNVKKDILNTNVKSELKDKNEFPINMQPENAEVKAKCSSHVTNDENVESSSQSSDTSNEATSQNTQNAESCEIFEIHSNSVGFLDTATAPGDSQSSSQSDEEKHNDMASQNSQSSEQNEIVQASSSNMNGADADVIISVIPCSFEKDIDSNLSNKHEVPKAKTEHSDINSSRILSEIREGKMDVENDKVNSDSTSVKFSVIEDDLSCEMHRIVDSVVSLTCKNNTKVELPENQMVSVKKIENVQNSLVPLINSDKESVTCDNEQNSPVTDENEEQSVELSSTKIIHDQLSSDCKENISNSAEEYNSNDVIMSSDAQNDSENSVQILANSVLTHAQNVNQVDLNCNEKNITETNAEQSASQCDIFSSELDHSYSSKTNEDSESSANKMEDDSNSSDEIDVVTVDPLCAYNTSLHNSSVLGHEISCLVTDLVVRIEKIDVENYFSNLDKDQESAVKTDTKSISSNSNHASNKENEHLTSYKDNKLAKGSKKRKIKPPIRSPFNFRQRSKKVSTKNSNVKSHNITHIKSFSDTKDFAIKSLFTKNDLKDDDEADNSMAKIISSIVDSITVDDDVETDILPHVPSSSHLPKTSRIGLSNDELTDLNTRLNAQIAHQTRRMKVIADSQTSTDIDNEFLQPAAPSINQEDSSTNTSSILKKRKASGEVSSKKARKVTFASPLIHELVFDSCTESRTIDAVTMHRIQNLNKKRKKILQEKNKTAKASSVQPPVSNEPDDIPSSSEYQDSDVVDFSDLPVSPMLINCPDDISNILKDLTSPSWVRGLESLLASKDIKTIGDVSKLNIHQVKALPFKSPKVATLHKALIGYLRTTQEATLEKIKTIDDGSFVEMNDAIDSLTSENSKTEKKGENSEDSNSVLLEETIKDILKKDSLKKLPSNLLAQLTKACGEAFLERHQSS